MKHLIVRKPPGPNGGKSYRCLSCGTTKNIGRRKYCSAECRQRLHYKLEVRTGLIKALNIQYATFYFSEAVIILDMLPYGTTEIFSFAYPRSPGKKPSDDFSTMADILGNIWWSVKKRTNKRHLASHYVLEQATRNNGPVISVKPSMIKLPSIKCTALSYLHLRKSELTAPELMTVIKNAYRRQAKIHHPDLGGDAETFRKIHQAYEDLLSWARNPTFIKRRGFPDKWFYDGGANRWVRPTPGQVHAR
ncbi:MAG: J domain-containing protein [Deltaproteobacteria bacterium]|nr:J domain-containing protein [Deltaproteobacteria bacterium]